MLQTFQVFYLRLALVWSVGKISPINMWPEAVQNKFMSLNIFPQNRRPCRRPSSEVPCYPLICLMEMIVGVCCLFFFLLMSSPLEGGIKLHFCSWLKSWFISVSDPSCPVIPDSWAMPWHCHSIPFSCQAPGLVIGHRQVQQGGVTHMSAEYWLEETLDDLLPMFLDFFMSHFLALSQ